MVYLSQLSFETDENADVPLTHQTTKSQLSQDMDFKDRRLMASQKKS